jgi:Cof subfamily protein (haloacid dehalogenase superfamily)
MTQFRVVASDLDGTLLGRNERVSLRTEATLRKVREQGVFVIAATGRTLMSARRLLAEGTIDLLVADNGALVFDPFAELVTMSRTIATQVIVDVFAKVRAEYPGAGFGWSTATGMFLDQSFVDSGYQLSERPYAHLVGDFDGTANVTKLLIAVPNLVQVALQRALEVLELGDVVIATSGAPFVEVSVAGCDKATTLAIICAERGVQPEQVIAFGDQMNDIAMLTWAGCGVAMGNAHAEAAAAANEQGLANTEDGVAAKLEQVLRSGLPVGKAPAVGLEAKRSWGPSPMLQLFL